MASGSGQVPGAGERSGSRKHPSGTAPRAAGAMTMCPGPGLLSQVASAAAEPGWCPTAASSTFLGAAAKIAPLAPARHKLAPRIEHDLVNGQDIGGVRDAVLFDDLQPDVPAVILSRDRDHVLWLTSGQLKHVFCGPPSRFHAAKRPRSCVSTIFRVAGCSDTGPGGPVPGAAASHPGPSLVVVRHIRVVALGHVVSPHIPRRSRRWR